MHIAPRKPREKAREFALRVLRENITSLTLKPGGKVSESELASKIGLSRTPVREALIELANYGIVEIFPQNGVFISKIDYRRIEESRFLRMALEVQAVQDACDLATPEFIEEMDDTVHIHAMYLENGNTKMQMRMDNKFHRLIFQLCGKLLSYALMKNMAVHFDRVRQLSLEVGRNLAIIEDHQFILDAVKARDKERARQAMTRHLTRYKTDKLLINEKFRDLISD